LSCKQKAHSEEWAHRLNSLVASRGIEPRTRGFSIQKTVPPNLSLLRRNVTNFSVLRVRFLGLPNRIPNRTELCGLPPAPISNRINPIRMLPPIPERTLYGVLPNLPNLHVFGGLFFFRFCRQPRSDERHRYSDNRH